MRISGHKTRTVFDRYNIVSTDDLKQAAQKMGPFHEMVTKTVTIRDSDEPTKTASKAQVIKIKR